MAKAEAKAKAFAVTFVTSRRVVNLDANELWPTRCCSVLLFDCCRIQLNVVADQLATHWAIEWLKRSHRKINNNNNSNSSYIRIVVAVAWKQRTQLGVLMRRLILNGEFWILWWKTRKLLPGRLQSLRDYICYSNYLKCNFLLCDSESFLEMMS